MDNVRLRGAHEESEEAWMQRSLENAKRYRWATTTKNGRRLVVPMPTAEYGMQVRGGEGPGSFLTGTQSELIFMNRTSGTALNTFTAEASISAGIAELGTTAGTINLGLPANFFAANGGVGKAVRVLARGVYSTTAAPTFTFGLRYGTAAGSLQATSIAWTAGTTLTNMFWQWECDMICLTAGPATTATSRVTGRADIQTAAAGTDVYIPFCAGSAFGTPTPATPTAAGFDSTIAQALVPTAACGTSSISNIMQLISIMVIGWN